MVLTIFLCLVSAGLGTMCLGYWVMWQLRKGRIEKLYKFFGVESPNIKKESESGKK